MAAAIDGHNKANESEPSVEPLTEADFEKMLEANHDWIVSSGPSSLQ